MPFTGTDSNWSSQTSIPADEAAASAFGAAVVDPAEILRVCCDVLAPCALGGVIHADTYIHILETAEREERTTLAVADAMAEAFLQ